MEAPMTLDLDNLERVANDLASNMETAGRAHCHPDSALVRQFASDLNPAVALELIHRCRYSEAETAEALQTMKAAEGVVGACFDHVRRLEVALREALDLAESYDWFSMPGWWAFAESHKAKVAELRKLVQQ
jgi:hypothetical protein